MGGAQLVSLLAYFFVCLSRSFSLPLSHTQAYALPHSLTLSLDSCSLHLSLFLFVSFPTPFLPRSHFTHSVLSHALSIFSSIHLFVCPHVSRTSRSLSLPRAIVAFSRTSHLQVYGISIELMPERVRAKGIVHVVNLSEESDQRVERLATFSLRLIFSAGIRNLHCHSRSCI